MRVRYLSPLGMYPNVELASGHASYRVRNARPFLITRNSSREERKWSFGSELSDWTRHETRLATAISCAQRGGFVLYLSSKWRDLPVAALAHVPTELQHTS